MERGLWITVAIATAFVLVVLIGRPHVEKLWYEQRFTVRMQPPGPPEIVVVGGPFPSFDLCNGKAVSDSAAAGAAPNRSVYSRALGAFVEISCKPRTVLLWGR